jgi:hypothetical protein
MVQSGALFVSESPWLHVFAAKVTVNSMSPTGSNSKLCPAFAAIGWPLAVPDAHQSFGSFGSA